MSNDESDEQILDEAAPRSVEIVAIGASTGGPAALFEMLGAIDAHFVTPVVITQHIPPVFSRYLAQRLNDTSPLDVHEAVDGELVRSGVALLAPGDVHLSLERTPLGIAVRHDVSPAVNYHRPSVDVMFRSVATIYGAAALAVVLSGSGRDGVGGCHALQAAGATVVVQNRASSASWGMPGAVVRNGLADQVVSIADMAAVITARTLASPALNRTVSTRSPTTGLR